MLSATASANEHHEQMRSPLNRPRFRTFSAANGLAPADEAAAVGAPAEAVRRWVRRGLPAVAGAYGVLYLVPRVVEAGRSANGTEPGRAKLNGTVPGTSDATSTRLPPAGRRKDRSERQGRRVHRQRHRSHVTGTATGGVNTDKADRLGEPLPLGPIPTGDVEEQDYRRFLDAVVAQVAHVTAELGETQRTLGRLTAERDAARERAAELQRRFVAEGADTPRVAIREERRAARAAEAPQTDDDPTAEPVSGESLRKSDRAGRREARLAARTGDASIAGEDSAPVGMPPELVGRADRAGRRRRVIAAVVVGLIIAVGIVTWQLDIELPDRTAARAGEYGWILQFLFFFLLIFRMGRLFGRVKNWLWPDNEKLERRERRRTRGAQGRTSSPQVEGGGPPAVTAPTSPPNPPPDR